MELKRDCSHLFTSGLISQPLPFVKPESLDSMKALELYTDQEIQALQKTMIKRFEMIEVTIVTDE